MHSDFITTRRWIAALSSIGAANMALGSLRQFGVIRHLPDPPIAGFDSNAVIMSDAAFALGVPDAPVAMAGLLANIPLSLLGGPRRIENRPWLPIGIAAKAVAEVGVAAWYLVQMKTRVHAWCAYCLVGATIMVLIAGFALPEAAHALPNRASRVAGAIGAALIVAGAMAAMSYIDARHRSRERGDRRATAQRRGSHET